MAAGNHPGFDRTEKIASFDPPTMKTIPYRTKHEVDRITHCGYMAIRIFRDVVILNLFEPEMAPFDPPTPKTLS